MKPSGPNPILVVVENPAHAERIRHGLAEAGNSHAIAVAERLAAAREAIATQPPRLVLVDWQLPDGHGIELLPDDDVGYPLVILAGKGDEATAVEAIKAGAIDCVVKSETSFAGIGGVVERALRDWDEVQRRKRAEEALRRSEGLFRSLTEHSHDLTVVLDTKGRARYVSPSVRRMLGRAPEEYDGRPLHRHVHPDDLGGLVSILRSLLRHPDKRFTTSARARHRDGSWRHFEVAGTTYQADDGIRCVLNARDVTDRVEAEEKRDTVEAALRRSQAFEAIGQLAAGIAHDFTNLFMIIGTHASFLEETEVGSERWQQSLAEIQRAQSSGAALIRQLLAFGGRQILKPEEVNLNRVVIEVERMVQRVLGERMQVTLDLDENVGAIRVDPAQLEQVLINLLLNARDAMPDGGQIRIFTEQREIDQAVERGTAIVPGTYVVLGVSDTGSGIPTDILPHIFEPFFTTKQPGRGTGLGLSTVFGIVRQSQGEVLVESEPGMGTTFRVFLPMLEPAVHPPAEEIPGEQKEPAGATETILVVEDDEDVRRVLVESLRAEGYGVFEAGSAEQALATSRGHPGPIQVLLTDLVLPGINGWDLAEQLRGERPETETIFMSGYAEETVAPRSMINASTRFISKPFEPSALMRLIRETLGERPGET